MAKRIITKTIKYSRYFFIEKEDKINQISDQIIVYSYNR